MYIYIYIYHVAKLVSICCIIISTFVQLCIKLYRCVFICLRYDIKLLYFNNNFNLIIITFCARCM